MGAFWGQDLAGGGIAEPKRNFRFRVTFGGLEDSFLWWAKSATKPSFTVAATEHKYLNHTFYYPGTVTWNEITITMVDPADPSMAASLSGLFKGGGYEVPITDEVLNTMTKSQAVASLGMVMIEQMDGLGTTMYESWTLHNAFISDIKYGDLSYGNDDLTELSVTLKYDWAKLTTDIASMSTAEGTDVNSFWTGTG